jgi:hypothetical protein
LESKKDIKKRGLPSPDLADALALTFAGGDDVQMMERKRVAETFNRKIVYPSMGAWGSFNARDQIHLDSGRSTTTAGLSWRS